MYSITHIMQIYYHGSSVLFPKFDLSHVLEGDGKVKFGYGVYLTNSFKSAAHYSETKSRPATTHYVYTVEIPDFTDDNHIDFKKPVHPEIIKRAEEQLIQLKIASRNLENVSEAGARSRSENYRPSIPEKFTLDGKDFRKYLAKQLGGGSDIQSEKLASDFLNKIGVEFITWPYNWKNPDLGLNVAVLDDKKVKITKIHQVELDEKKQLIQGSEKEVKL